MIPAPRTLRRRAATLVSAAVALAVVASGCGRYATSDAAVVDGRPISFDSLDAEVRRENASEEARRRLDAGGEQLRMELRRQAILQLVRRELIFGEVERQRIVVGGADVDRRVADLIRTAGSRARFEQQLAAEGLTETALRERLRQEAALEALIDRVSPVRVSDAEIRNAYQARRAEYGQVRLSHILFAVGPGQTDQAALARALETVRAIRGGGDFAALARERSDDEASAAQGGDLGFVPRSDLGGQVGAAVDRLARGAVTEPLRTDAGYHVIEVTGRRTLTLAQVAADLRESILGAKRESVLQALLRRIVDRANIEINPRLGDLDRSAFTIVDHRLFTDLSNRRSPVRGLDPP